ncbi:MAG: hypothetical protein GDA53_10335 [Rhodobacteraceae bacterium]|nr:hypothetical protein [Paracoccaceae bacterium]
MSNRWNIEATNIVDYVWGHSLNEIKRDYAKAILGEYSEIQEIFENEQFHDIHVPQLIAYRPQTKWESYDKDNDDLVITFDLDDIIVSHGGEDFIFTHGGDDVITTNTGKAFIDAGTGSDRITTTSGPVTLYFAEGHGHDKVHKYYPPSATAFVEAPSSNNGYVDWNFAHLFTIDGQPVEPNYEPRAIVLDFDLARPGRLNRIESDLELIKEHRNENGLKWKDITDTTYTLEDAVVLEEGWISEVDGLSNRTRKFIESHWH